MGHRRSEKRAERESLMLQALERIAKKKWKNPAQAAKALGISRHTIGRTMEGKVWQNPEKAVQLLTIPEENASL